MDEFLHIKSLCRQLPEDSQHFPAEVFTLLHDLGFLQRNLPENYQNVELKFPLFEILFKLGSANLSVGRIYEGHINAIKLIKQLGSDEQKRYYFSEIKNGRLFSVWNTELNYEALKAIKMEGKFRLYGAKTFCSGGLHIDYALVTAAINKKKQLIIIPLKDHKELNEDWSLWKPMGMKNSVSCRIDFTNLVVPIENLLGDLNSYEIEPWFTGGAMRFATVQLGGAEAIVIAAIDHLKNLKRENDPYQQQRFGIMAVQIESGKLWIEKAQQIENNSEHYTKEEIILYANIMRTAILDICEKILGLAERSVGVQGFMMTHPMEQAFRDLKVYLKQPGPDASVKNVGTYYLNKYR